MNRISMTLILLLGSTMLAFAWSFSDVTTDDMRWQSEPVVYPSIPYASCVAWGDINNDGQLDLFVGSDGWHNSQLYLNDGHGGFTNASNTWGMDRFTNIRSAQLLDYDRDGLLDLFLITNHPEPLELYKQTSATRLVSVRLDMQSANFRDVSAVVWNDVNRDGRMDMIVNAVGDDVPEVSVLIADENSMSLNRDGLLPENIENASTIGLIDYNLDGRLDVFVGSEDGGSRFLQNNGDYYSDMRERLGLPEHVGATGLAWGDFNQDSYLDFATCGSPTQTGFYMGGVVNQNLVFHDVLRDPSGTGPTDILMDYAMFRAITNASSVHAIDANMDGWTDLFYVNASAGSFLLLNEQGHGWTYDPSINAAINRGHLPATAAAWADIDNDGDPDLALSCNEDGVLMLRNDLEIEHEYFTVRIADSQFDTPLLNCQVLVKFQDSGRQWATTSMASSSVGFDDMVCKFVNPTREHSRVLSITVVWPSGALSQCDIDDVTLWGETVIRPPLLSPGDLTGDNGSDRIGVPRPALMATLQNTPNPFNPSTTLNYTVPEAGWVELSVVNVLGQEVMSLVSGYSDAGVHAVHFDASTLPSGMYIARLNTAGQTMLHRMILTK